MVAEAGEVSLRIKTAREVLFFGEVGRMGVYGPGTSDGDDLRLAITPPIVPPMPPRSVPHVAYQQCQCITHCHSWEVRKDPPAQPFFSQVAKGEGE